MLYHSVLSSMHCICEQAEELTLLPLRLLLPCAGAMAFAD
jgi:hypothetical protein